MTDEKCPHCGLQCDVDGWCKHCGPIEDLDETKDRMNGHDKTPSIDEYNQKVLNALFGGI